MKFSNNGIKMLKQLEGCVKKGDRHIIYDDKNCKPVNTNKTLPKGSTIGYGHLIKAGEDFKNGITEAIATELLQQDISFAEQTVKNNITIALTQNQYDALVIFAYNIGEKNFANSTVVKYINNPKFHNIKYPNLESAWKAWNKYNGCEMTGLTKRRRQEFDLFNS